MTEKPNICPQCHVRMDRISKGLRSAKGGDRITKDVYVCPRCGHRFEHTKTIMALRDT